MPSENTPMPSKLIILGANGALGSQVTRLALQAGHAVTAVARNPAKLERREAPGLTVHQADIAALRVDELAALVRGHDALINTAGMVTQGEAFVALVDHIVTAVEALPATQQPVCWFLAGAGLLDLDVRGRRGLDLPVVRKTYWPHARNLARLQRSSLDWRLLCPGPMVASAPVGVARLRTSTDKLPVAMPSFMGALPGVLALPAFARRMPEMVVSYVDAAALILANLLPDSPYKRRRVGLALPEGMRGSKDQWSARKT
jgi:putative NADH-flavin reductase